MNPKVILQLANQKEIVLQLYPEVAPNSVNNFLSLVDAGFYDGLIFHRVIPHFMVQGGCPLKNGTGGPGYGIAGEFGSNGFKNDLKHKRGVLSMARAQNPNSAGSQFFIMVEASPHLDGQYAAFGEVISDMAVVDEIVDQDRNHMDKPLVDVVIEKAYVDLGDYEIKPVKKM